MAGPSIGAVNAGRQGGHKMNFGLVMYTTGFQGYAFRQLVAQVT